MHLESFAPILKPFRIGWLIYDKFIGLFSGDKSHTQKEMFYSRNCGEKCIFKLALNLHRQIFLIQNGMNVVEKLTNITRIKTNDQMISKMMMAHDFLLTRTQWQRLNIFRGSFWCKTLTHSYSLMYIIFLLSVRMKYATNKCGIWMQNISFHLLAAQKGHFCKSNTRVKLDICREWETESRVKS